MKNLPIPGCKTSAYVLYLYQSRDAGSAVRRNRASPVHDMEGSELTMNHMNPDIVHLHDRLPTLTPRRVWAEIDTDALVHNYTVLSERVRRVSPDTRAFAVVKADAYGHGIRPCARALIGAGCRAFAVACLEEAIALRMVLLEPDLGPAPDRFGTRPADSLILILGYTAPEDAALLARYAVSTALVSATHARAMAAAASAAGVTVQGHVALDTGMNRIGFPAHTPEEIVDTIRTLIEVSRLPGLSVEGMFTHFAKADEDYDVQMADGSLTDAQYTRYAAVLDGLTAAGCRPAICHVCNSAAAVRFPGRRDAACLDAVRLGINLYGYGVPFPDEGAPALRPVMKLRAAVTHIHTLLPGETVGYGGTYGCDAPRRLVTLPVGYADGLIRACRGMTVTLHTVAGDFRVPLAGRICMDQCMADVTDVPEDAIRVGDVATFFGSDPFELEALADRAGTITYELLCLITARVPRVCRS